MTKAERRIVELEMRLDRLNMNAGENSNIIKKVNRKIRNLKKA